MHRSSPHPQSGSRLWRQLTALALALALGQLSAPMLAAALALSLQEPAPPAAPAESPEVKRALEEGFQELKRRASRPAIAPPISLETLDGDRISLADLHGKITLLDFWATWCAPCVASVPSLKKIAAQMAQEPFTLISVSGDRNGAKVRDFVASHGTTWPQCWDGNGSVQGQFRVRVLPTFLLLDSDGRILFSKTGWGRRAEGELLSEIRKAVQTLKAAAGKSAP